MRFSEMLIPTLREDPGEAEVISHRLMLRAGMIRKLAAGFYTYLPMGYRVVRKVEAIVREEMDRIGAQEILMPIAQPAELWQETGRWGQYGKELMRLTDRHNREFCLGPTHEEVVTDLIRREVRSYRQIPLILYQIQSKFRDEIRPRFGLMRGREFIMKDAYSFDRDEAGAQISYRKVYEAYERIFSRCGLISRAVEADTGLIGGRFSHEFMVLAGTGEEDITLCTSCEYAANVERAGCQAVKKGGGKGEEYKSIEKVSTPRKKSVEEVTSFLGLGPDRVIKTIFYNTEKGPIAALVRGDHEVNETKLRNVLACRDLTRASPEVIQEATKGPVGFSGPIGVTVPLIADLSVESMVNCVTGANEEDTHYINVNLNRDFKVEQFADIRKVREGDLCPRCSGSLVFKKGIEVGHVFMLGTKYSEAMSALFLDEAGGGIPFMMGCYGIGIGRTVAAAIEQNHDQDGIIWPIPLAPFQVWVLPVNMEKEGVRKTSEEVYHSLRAEGVEVIIDDREERPGVKFKDADLIGVPYQVVVGEKNLEKGLIEVKERRSRERRVFPLEKVGSHLLQLFGDSLAHKLTPTVFSDPPGGRPLFL